MVKSDVITEYYLWLLDIIRFDEHEPQYEDVMYALFRTEFTYTLEMDANRAGDGEQLRSDYTYAQGLSEAYLEELDRDLGPCNVLEMMIALAKRGEDAIMYSPEKGDRTAKWFWIMVKNLGLDETLDPIEGFDEASFMDKIEKFLERRYEKSGHGGLFWLKSGHGDLRKVEIWYQMMWFFSENYDF